MRRAVLAAVLAAAGLGLAVVPALAAAVPTSAAFGWGDESLTGSWLGGSQLTPIGTVTGTGFTDAGFAMLTGTTSGCAGTMVTLHVLSDTEAQFVVPQSFPTECWGEVIAVGMAAADYSWFYPADMSALSPITFTYPVTGDVSPYYVPPPLPGPSPSPSEAPSPSPSPAASPSPSCPPTICTSSPPPYVPPPPADPLSLSVSSALQGALLQGLATTIAVGVVGIVLLTNVLRLVHMFRR